MFETPRIVPHTVEHADAEPSTEVRDIDIVRYGYCYEPKSTVRVSNSPEIEGEMNMKNDHDEDDVSYGSGRQGAGK